MSIRTHLTKLATLAKRRSTTRFFMNRVLWYHGMPWTQLQPQPLEQAFPDITDAAKEITVLNPLQRTMDTSVELDELAVILILLRHSKASRVLEVGTWDGNTTLNLAANLGSQGAITTLDLPPDKDNEGALLKPGEILNETPRQHRGEQFREHPLAERITQVYGDSGKIDWSTLGGPFDFAFLDGCHTSAYVHSDTINALRTMQPGGMVLWHDYQSRPVARVLDTYAALGEPLHWIRGTRVAAARFPDPAATLNRLQNLSF